MPKAIKLCEGKSIGENEIKYVEKALNDFQISNHGYYIESFEEKLKSYLNTEKAVSVLNSGTSAIHMALVLCGVTTGDEVLCQSYTFCATANPITYIGANPIFIDSETDTYNMCPNFLEDAIKSRMKLGKLPKAIIVTHSYGMPAKIIDLLEIAKRYNIKLIEDAAEALGSEVEGKKCGTFGDYGIFSFNANKIITSAGGGALICKTETEKNRVNNLAKQAKESQEFYLHSELGYNYKLNNINAAIGVAQLETIQERIILKRNIFEFYKSCFSKRQNVKLLEEKGINFSNYWINVIQVENSTLRNNIVKRFQENNIEIRPVWNPMHLQPLYDGCLFFGKNESKKMFNEGLCLPSGISLKKEDLNRIATIFNQLI